MLNSNSVTASTHSDAAVGEGWWQSFADHSGADLGSYEVDPERTIGELLLDIVEESGLPKTNFDGSPKRYEAYHRGRKLLSRVRAKDCGIGTDAEPVEIFPSVVTGGAM